MRSGRALLARRREQSRWEAAQHGESQPGKYTATDHHERVQLNIGIAGVSLAVSG